MKIAVMIMMADKEPSLRNKQAIMNYIVDDYNNIADTLEHTYDFIFYKGHVDKELQFSKNILDRFPEKHCYEIITCTGDGVHDTFEKTIECFKTLDSINKYDWIIRINISTYINIRLIDKLINSMDKNHIYCNAINGVLQSETYLNYLYPRGDFYMISKDLIDKVIYVSDEFYIHKNDISEIEKIYKCPEHVDDVLLGICLYKALGKEYYKNLYPLYYDYYPDIFDPNNKRQMHYYTIAVRLKTVPKNMHSGWSWNDDPCRLDDVNKFRLCYECFSNVQPYEDNDIIKFVTPKDERGRKIGTMIFSMLPIEKIEDYLSKTIK